MQINYTITKETTIKDFLIEHGFSVNQISKLLNNKNNLLINGKEYNVDYYLHPSDNLKIIFEEEKPNITPIAKDIDIVFEDDFFLVVNKPKWLSTIPSKLHYDDNLAGRVLYYFNCHNIDCGIHIINRLDYLTCGLVVFAKASFIQQQMTKTKIIKKYHALVGGILTKKEDTINLKIEKSNNGIERLVSEKGKTAITKYKVIEENQNSSLLEIALQTGRTHQIRVHLSYIGHPLVGDTLYNINAKNDKDFYLCSYFMSFVFPVNNKQYIFTI